MTTSGTLTISPTNVSAQQVGLILHDKGGGGAEACWINWTSGSYSTGVKLMGKPDTNTLVFHDGTDWRNVIHSGNISSQTVANATNCLPLSGGTITGTITGNTGAGIIFQSSNAPGSWTQGIRVYPASNDYSLMSLQDSTSKNVFAMVTNVSTHTAYFDYCQNGSNRQILMPYKNGTIALTSDIPSTISWSNVTDKPSTFEPSSHTHSSSTLTDIRLTWSSSVSTTDWFLAHDTSATGTPLFRAISPSNLRTCIGAATSSHSHSEFTGTAAMTNLVVSNDNSQSSYDALAYFRHYSTNDWTIKIDDGGRDYGLYIANSGSNACKIDGNLTCTNAYVTSDKHLKKDISTIDKSSLERLFDISDKLLKQFTWKQTGKVSYGLIAQELEQYIPEAVETSDVDGYKSVNYEVAYAKILAMVIYKLKTLIQ